MLTFSCNTGWTSGVCLRNLQITAEELKWWSFTLSRPGIESWPLDIQSRAYTSQPWTSINFQLLSYDRTNIYHGFRPPFTPAQCPCIQKPQFFISESLWWWSDQALANHVRLKPVPLFRRNIMYKMGDACTDGGQSSTTLFPELFFLEIIRRMTHHADILLPQVNQHPNVRTWQNSMTHHAGILLPRVNQHSNVHTWQNLVPSRWRAQILRRTGSRHRPDLPPQESDHTRK